MTQFNLSIDWDKFVPAEIASWKNRIIKWISIDGNFTRNERVKVIHYENLIHDRENEFRKLVHYLQLNVDEDRLACTIKHDFDAFKRNSSTTIKKYLIAIKDPSLIIYLFFLPK